MPLALRTIVGWSLQALFYRRGASTGRIRAPWRIRQAAAARNVGTVGHQPMPHKWRRVLWHCRINAKSMKQRYGTAAAPSRFDAELVRGLCFLTQPGSASILAPRSNPSMREMSSRHARPVLSSEIGQASHFFIASDEGEARGALGRLAAGGRALVHELCDHQRSGTGSLQPVQIIGIRYPSFPSSRTDQRKQRSAGSNRQASGADAPPTPSSSTTGSRASYPRRRKSVFNA